MIHKENKICKSLAVIFIIGCLIINAFPIISVADADQVGNPWNFTTNQSFTNERHEIDDDLIIDGCTVTFTGCTLVFNSISEGSNKVSIINSGRLELYQTTMVALDPLKTYKFEVVQGDLDMNNAGISDIWGSSSTLQGGIEIKTGANYVNLVDSRIKDCSKSSIYMTNVNPNVVSITDSRIGNSEIGIFAQSSSFNLENSKIYDTTGIGIKCINSNPVISSNHFKNSGIGIDLITSSPLIEDCRFEGNIKDIQLDSAASQPLVWDNTYSLSDVDAYFRDISISDVSFSYGVWSGGSQVTSITTQLTYPGYTVPEDVYIEYLQTDSTQTTEISLDKHLVTFLADTATDIYSPTLPSGLNNIIIRIDCDELIVENEESNNERLIVVPVYEEDKGNWVIPLTPPEILTDKVFKVTTLTVNGYLELTRCSLLMDSPSGTQGISVATNGYLSLDTVKIVSYDQILQDYSIDVYGQVIITDSSIYDAKNAINLNSGSSTDSSITNTVIKNAVTGINVIDTTLTTDISNNEFINCNYGISLSDSEYIRVSDNYFYQNSKSIHIDDGTWGSLTNNEFFQSGSADITMEGAVELNNIYQKPSTRAKFAFSITQTYVTTNDIEIAGYDGLAFSYSVGGETKPIDITEAYPPDIDGGPGPTYLVRLINTPAPVTEPEPEDEEEEETTAIHLGYVDCSFTGNDKRVVTVEPEGIYQGSEEDDPTTWPMINADPADNKIKTTMKCQWNENGDRKSNEWHYKIKEKFPVFSANKLIEGEVEGEKNSWEHDDVRWRWWKNNQHGSHLLNLQKSVALFHGQAWMFTMEGKYRYRSWGTWHSKSNSEDIFFFVGHNAQIDPNGQTMVRDLVDKGNEDFEEMVKVGHLSAEGYKVDINYDINNPTEPPTVLITTGEDNVETMGAPYPESPMSVIDHTPQSDRELYSYTAECSKELLSTSSSVYTLKTDYISVIDALDYLDQSPENWDWKSLEEETLTLGTGERHDWVYHEPFKQESDFEAKRDIHIVRWTISLKTGSSEEEFGESYAIIYNGNTNFPYGCAPK